MACSRMATDIPGIQKSAKEIYTEIDYSTEDSDTQCHACGLDMMDTKIVTA